jgi:hypothetical protein
MLFGTHTCEFLDLWVSGETKDCYVKMFDGTNLSFDGVSWTYEIENPNLRDDTYIRRGYIAARDFNTLEAIIKPIRGYVNFCKTL